MYIIGYLKLFTFVKVTVWSSEMHSNLGLFVSKVDWEDKLDGADRAYLACLCLLF